MISNIHNRIFQRAFVLSCLLFAGCVAHVATGHLTVFMIGDSTMANKPNPENPERGWGQMFPMFFDGSVTIDNHAMNGRSTRSFLAENRWQPVLDKLKPGDYVFIQFGHNDESPQKVDRYTPPADYKKNLIKFVNETRDKKAEPILCTSIVRREFDKQGKLTDTHGAYPDLVREVAAEYKVPLIDMQKKSEKLVAALGPDSSKKIFLWVEKGTNKAVPDGKQDNTHFCEYGATEIARLAVEGLRELKIDLQDHLKQ
jgi:DNA sulfur modification protein DndE